MITFLGEQGLVFRRNDDSKQSFNKGNYNFYKAENKYSDDHLKNYLPEQYTSPLILKNFIFLITQI